MYIERIINLLEPWLKGVPQRGENPIVSVDLGEVNDYPLPGITVEPITDPQSARSFLCDVQHYKESMLNMATPYPWRKYVSGLGELIPDSARDLLEEYNTATLEVAWMLGYKEVVDEILGRKGA